MKSIIAKLRSLPSFHIPLISLHEFIMYLHCRKLALGQDLVLSGVAFILFSCLYSLSSSYLKKNPFLNESYDSILKAPNAVGHT